MSTPRRLQFMVREFALAIVGTAQQRSMTMADVARETRVDEATLSLMQRHGRVPHVCGCQALASWAGLDLGDYVKLRNA